MGRENPVSRHLRPCFKVSETARGGLRLVRWWVGWAHIEGRMVGFCGWNLPLARATRLGAQGERALGQPNGWIQPDRHDFCFPTGRDSSGAIVTPQRQNVGHVANGMADTRRVRAITA